MTCSIEPGSEADAGRCDRRLVRSGALGFSDGVSGWIVERGCHLAQPVAYGDDGPV